MPYISQPDRDSLYKIPIERQSPGELNYRITNFLIHYMKGRESYTTLNEIIGVLECVKQEFYRRVVVPYEEKKREENGDVY